MQQKVMVFIVPNVVKTGVINTEVRFPYPGKIIDVYASVSGVGLGDTDVQLEVCRNSDFTLNPIWVGLDTVTIPTNSNYGSTVPVIPTVHPKDHFRINVLSVGAEVRDLTLEVIIEI